MLFNVEHDGGSTITGYVVPDDADSSTAIVVLSQGTPLWSGPADEPRPALVSAGRHMTGLCGFRVGADQIPDLAALTELEIREAATRLPIYRRHVGPVLPRRVLHLETRLRRRAGFDAAVGAAFHLAYANIDALGHETASQTFLLNGVGSLYLSGRLLVQPYVYLIEQGFEVMAALRDPFEELAERIGVLASPEAARDVLSDRDRMVFGRAIEALEGVDATDPTAVQRFFRRLDRDVGAVLSNPLTRQLTTTRPDELCSGDAVSAALRTLAMVDLVAVDDGHGLFEEAVHAWLEGVSTAGHALRAEPVVERIADVLAGLRIVESMLDFDLEVYHSAAAAMERLCLPPDQGGPGETTGITP